MRENLRNGARQHQTTLKLKRKKRRLNWKEEEKKNAWRRKCHNCSLYFPRPAS